MGTPQVMSTITMSGGVPAAMTVSSLPSDFS